MNNIVVFLSYSSFEEKIGQDIVKNLEDRDIKCWIASRDIDIGDDYADSIVEAIQESKFFILIYTKNYTVSKHTKRELDIAIELNKKIIPLVINNSILKDIDYRIRTIQCVNFVANTENYDNLCKHIKNHKNSFKIKTKYNVKSKKLPLILLIILTLGIYLYLNIPKFYNIETKGKYGYFTNVTDKVAIQGENLNNYFFDWKSNYILKLKENDKNIKILSDFVCNDKGTLCVLNVELNKNKLPFPSLFFNRFKILPKKKKYDVKVSIVKYTQKNYMPIVKMIKKIFQKINKQEEFFFNIEFEIETQNDYKKIAAKIKSGEIDLLYTTPLVFLKIEDILNNAIKMIACNMTNGKSYYRSVLFSNSSNINLNKKMLLKLKPTIVWGNKNSTSGYFIPNTKWGKIFNKLKLEQYNLNNHTDVIEDVLSNNKKIKIGASHKNILSIVSNNKKYKYKILWESMPIPHGGIGIVNSNNQKGKQIQIAFNNLLLQGNLKLDSKINDVEEITACSEDSFNQLRDFYCLHVKNK